MKTIIIKTIIIFILLYSDIFAQNQINKEIPLLYIKNIKFTEILDTAIFLKEQRHPGIDTLIFTVRTEDYEDCKFITITYLHKIDDVFLNPYGYFNYKKHLFFIEGDFFNAMFKKLHKSRTFLFKEDTKNKLPDIYDTTDWNYKYYKGKFELISINDFE